MEIECPDHAIAVWLEGDQVMIRFPDRQLVHVNVWEMQRLVTIMKHRADFALRGRRLGLGTKAAPVQYDIDQIARAMRTHEELMAAKVRKKAERVNEREAQDILEICGF